MQAEHVMCWEISIWLCCVSSSASRHLSRSTRTTTGLILTRPAYGLTTGVLLVIRMWRCCVKRRKYKCRAPERPSPLCSRCPAGLSRFYVNEANQRPASGFTAAIAELSNIIWGIWDEGVSAAWAQIKNIRLLTFSFHIPYISVWELLFFIEDWGRSPYDVCW